LMKQQEEPLLSLQEAKAQVKRLREQSRSAVKKGHATTQQ